MDARFLPVGAAVGRVTTWRVDFVAVALAAVRGRAGRLAFATDRFRAGARFATRARAAGLRAFFVDRAAALRFGAARFRLAVFLAAVRLRPAAFRPPVVFLPARPELRRGAFRLAMGRPFSPALA